MIYAGMTFFASAFWSFICFSIYLLLSCDGGMVIRWGLGLIVIAMYRPLVRLMTMNVEELVSLLLACVGIAAAIFAFLFMLAYISR